MIKALQMTECSWILSKGSSKYGIIVERDKKYIVLGGVFRGIYDDVGDLEARLKDKIKFESKVIEDVEYTVGDYTVNDQPFDIELDGEFPTFTKKEGSSIRFAAGFFALKYEKWQTSVCPKVKTLEEREWVGPFRDKITMDHEIRIRNNDSRSETSEH